MDLYSFPPQPPRFDAIGTFYVAFCVSYTTVLLCAIGYLVANRRSPILKVRGLGLSLTSILFLHAYWILAQVVYPVGAAMPVILAYDIQYFFMGIWLPLGIALFHASNLHFLHVAKLQKQYTHSTYRKISGCNGASSSWLCRLRCMDYNSRVLILIISGMVLQVLLTVGMWVACKKYHPTFGIPGSELHGATIPEQLIDLGRGWEWWPSVLWQVIWTWIVAPILIWRSWGIHDTLGWRTQTIACCLASLHATPMFMVASYVPAFYPINAYFAPSEWIHLSTMFFEVFTVFVPCYLVFRQKIQIKKAVDTNAKWDTQSQTTLVATQSRSPPPSPDWKTMSHLEKGYSTDSSKEDSTDCLLTMTALNRVLEDNPAPLQEFSALRDFSGENISFLTRVAQWKATVWPANPTEDEFRDAFTQALGIYTDFISAHDAEFPINLSSQELRDLEAVFERPARIICGDARVNTVVPFEGSGLTAPPRRRNSHETAASSQSRIDLGDVVGKLRYTGEISADFGPKVFDRAQRDVKYLVLTNTWPKFVHETQRRQSLESERSDYSDASRTSSLVARVTQAIRDRL